MGQGCLERACTVSVTAARRAERCSRWLPSSGRRSPGHRRSIYFCQMARDVRHLASLSVPCLRRQPQQAVLGDSTPPVSPHQPRAGETAIRPGLQRRGCMVCACVGSSAGEGGRALGTTAGGPEPLPSCFAEPAGPSPGLSPQSPPCAGRWADPSPVSAPKTPSRGRALVVKSIRHRVQAPWEG